jgi:hypothetical protein
VPTGGKPGAKPYTDYVFVGHPAGLIINSPSEYIDRIPLSVQLPAFWFAAGAQDPSDVSVAAGFRQELLARQLLQTRELLRAEPPIPFLTVAGGHQGSVWRAALVPMLKWMTPQLSQAAVKANDAAARAAERAEAERRARERKAKVTPPHSPGSPKPTAKATPSKTT